MTTFGAGGEGQAAGRSRKGARQHSPFAPGGACLALHAQHGEVGIYAWAVIRRHTGKWNNLKDGPKLLSCIL